jgi:tetratricopeptide (TPR) repeat protein
LPRPAVEWRRAIPAALVAAVVLLYWRVGGFPFVEYDDQQYVTANPVVLSGLTLQGVKWAFTTFHASNWHPLTWLSHMADVTLFGPDAGWPHRVNALLHLANTLLLFRLLNRTTGRAWESGFAAALFALHPLHVESVAWVSERKDVLSALFWFLAADAWVRWCARPSVLRYLPVAGFMAASLMSKPMAVTLPFTLLLLDAWPLRRLASRGIGRLLLEKAPLFLLSAASCAVTVAAARAEGLNSLDAVPMGARLANASLAYIEYLRMTAWPAGLAVFYPHPYAGVSLPAAGLAAAGLAVATVAAIRFARGRPYLAFGWFWYLGTLVPVIGLVQVGGQAMADRYAYVPLVGIFVALAWGASDRVSAWRIPQGAAAAAAGVVLAALAACAWVQVGYWGSTEALFGHALAVTKDNLVAHETLGVKAAREERLDEALSHFREVARIRPGYADPWCVAGRILARQGKPGEAEAAFREALRLRPGYAEAHAQLGMLLAGRGAAGEAAAHLREALRLAPDDPEANLAMAELLDGAGRKAEAAAFYNKAFGSAPK